ncbi:MAG: N-formylglutamate deformylase [Alphaproteobacteria bacterium]|nr:N-formylglutamate deformylase [Alphaproteobacteria bacterium]MDE2112590.1 N-formylglutamate deformylase [Alphaproteobacteria bacterium]MDE2494075.1 N-formylglutamate deformylase [Alphaproteobacteria bacterium]
MTEIFRLKQGKAPLLISFPHSGEALPDALRPRLTDEALTLDDTDFILPELYDFAEEFGASTIEANYSRYVVDPNRPPDDTSLYPGQNTTGIMPVMDFFGRALYRPGMEPDDDERAARIQFYWKPYHDALAAELERQRAVHRAVLLWDAHSIRNNLPYLFAGTLPDLNIGTAAGASAAARVETAVEQAARRSGAYSVITNGRFKGGYITRHYGRPSQGIHAVQLEMSKTIYLGHSQRPPLDANRAIALRVTLRGMLRAALEALAA